MNFDYMTEAEEAIIDEMLVGAVPAEWVSKYTRQIKPEVYVDVYDVLLAWGVTNPALQHLIKKALQAGNRGHKDLATDLQDIIDSATRAKELEINKP